MKTPDITYLSLLFCSLLLILPVLLSVLLRLKISTSIVITSIRMTIQLFLIGVFLKYLFHLNNKIVNIGWVLLMIIVTTFTVIKRNQLKMKIFLSPVLFSLIISLFVILLYFNIFVIKIKNILHARYLIVIGGMLLGNSLRANIIGIGNFYRKIKREENRYLYRLSTGGSVMETLMPYFRESLKAAINPTLATMATMGIIALPGMMTGQILGGVSPILAIKYQITIMIAIFVTTTISIYLTILLTIKTCFSSYGILSMKIFKN